MNPIFKRKKAEPPVRLYEVGKPIEGKVCREEGCNNPVYHASTLCAYVETGHYKKDGTPIKKFIVVDDHYYCNIHRP